MSSKVVSGSVVDENPTAGVTSKAFGGARATATGTTATRRALGDVTNGAAGAGLPRARSSRPSSAATVESTASTAASVASSSAASHATASTAAAASTSSVRMSLSSASSSLRTSEPSLEEQIAAVTAADAANPNRVGAYVNAIMRHHFTEEGRKTPSATFMSRQTDVTPKMRGILIDWLIEVHVKFRMMPETLFLCINVIDRFLERKTIARNKLQLLGVTSLFVASKICEIFAPECRDIVYVCDKAYTREEILRMEQTVLSVLSFNLTVPTTLNFLHRFLKVCSADTRTTHLANYFAERMLQEYSMLKHLPSAIAASAVLLANKAVKGGSGWSPLLQHFSGYSERSLSTAVTEMHTLMSNASTASLQSVRKKYSSTKLSEVARIPLPSL